MQKYSAGAIDFKNANFGLRLSIPNPKHIKLANFRQQQRWEIN
jgi:hypothetical protein